MGLLSWLLGGERAAASAADLLPMPRGQLYVFEHIALPALFYKDPLVMLALMANGGARQRVLGSLFDEVTADLRGRGEPTPVPRPRFKAHCQNVNGLLSAVVEMPAPRAATECHLVAFTVPEAQVQRVGDAPEGEAKSDAASMRARYFTLELGVRVETSALRTVLCEWRQGEHVNYGDGPPSTVEAFLAAVDDVTSGRR